jgi:small neutral amino acid transporter SnatA (MarC family)
MPGFGYWNIILAIALVCLVLSAFWYGRKQIWASLVMGTIAGCAIALISLVTGNGFNWHLGLKIASVAVVAGGFLAALDWWIGKKEAKKKKEKRRKRKL